MLMAAAVFVAAALEGAILLALFLLSGALEPRAMGRAHRAAAALIAWRPDIALRLRGDDSQNEVALAALMVGDQLLHSGARMPLDGLALEGACTVDESTVIGESIPVSEAGATRCARRG